MPDPTGAVCEACNLPQIGRADRRADATPPIPARFDAYNIFDSLLEGCQVIDRDWRYVYLNQAAVQQARKTQEELLGRTMMEVYPGIEHTATYDLLKRAMEGRQVQCADNAFTYPDGTTGWFELRVQPVPDGVFVLSMDITGRKRAEIASQQQLDRLHALRAIDLAILGTTDVGVALKTILFETRRHLRVDAAAVFLFNAEMAMLELVGTDGFRVRASEKIRQRFGEGVTGRAAQSRRTVTLLNLAEDDSSARSLPAAWLEEAFRACCTAPLIARGRLIGVLAVAHRTPLTVNDGWLEFLEALAGQTAMAVDAARSCEALERAHLELTLAYETTIEGWSNALDLRDQDTSYHTRRVADLTVELARRAGLSEGELVHVRRGALLHDIGKMGIPDAILCKPGALTEEEWGLMRQHPTFAYELLSPIAYLRPALDIPYAHHEKWDGTGYPRGLKGEAIPLPARLFAVVDVWDALRSDRPYRRGWPEDRVRGHLTSLAGTHFDPQAVTLFLSLIENS
jgi:PAS domain S-box-containing protein